MKSSLSYEKVWFILSLLALSFLYGAGVGKWGWFPHSFLNRAVDQARSAELPFFQDPTGGNTHEKVYGREGVQLFNARRVHPGMTAITSWWETPDGPRAGIKLVDREGEVLHKWLVERKEVFEGGLLQRRDPTGTDIQGSLLLPDGDVVVNLEYVGMARLNSCGKVQWTLTEGNHHSIVRDENGSFWVPGVSQKLRTGTDRYPDLPGLESIWLDRILNVSAEGKILRDIKVVDILYENDLERLFFQHNLPKGDVTHINDVEPLSSSMAQEYPLFDAGDLLVSLRHINLVFVFDPETMEVKWHVSDPFIYQHDPDFIGGGWVGVFDNNRFRSREGSRIIAFQPHTDSTKVLFQGEHLDRFYTRHRGKWQMLENGNMLLTEEEAGRVIEVSSEGKPVWEWIHESYGSKVPTVTKATRHDLTRDEVASWPCSSVDSISASAQNTSTQNQQITP